LLSQAKNARRLSVLRVPVSELVTGEMTLDTDASRYLARVHRVKPGDAIVLFDPAVGREAEARVAAVDKSSVRVAVSAIRAATVRAERAVTLVQAIGKGDKLDAIARDITELGATRLVVAETARSVVRLGGRAEERMQRIRRIVVQAARQCGRGDAPEVLGPLPWEEALRAATTPGGTALCLWEHATDPIGPRLRRLGPVEPLAIAVGAEGGLEAAEIDAAISAGFAPVSLGPFILRTETVPAAVLGAVLFGGT
jgi:16S rRNA (uracil1498-N3)-methyltransferase